MPVTETVQVWRDGVLVSSTTVTLSEGQGNEVTLTGRLADALPELRTLANTTGTLTAAQLSTGVRLAARMLLAVIRLHLQRLESSD